MTCKCPSEESFQDWTVIRTSKQISWDVLSEWTARSMKWVDPGGSSNADKELNPHTPLAPSEAPETNKNCSTWHWKRLKSQMAMGRIPQEEGLSQSWQSGLVLVTLRGYKCALREIDTYSELDFANLVIDANAQNTIKIPKQKILHQFGPLSHISSLQGTCFIPMMSNNGQRDIPLRPMVR